MPASDKLFIDPTGLRKGGRGTPGPPPFFVGASCAPTLNPDRSHHLTDRPDAVASLPTNFHQAWSPTELLGRNLAPGNLDYMSTEAATNGTVHFPLAPNCIPR